MHEFIPETNFYKWYKIIQKKNMDLKATKFLHANEDDKTFEFEIVNDSHSLSCLQTNHDLSNRRKFATWPSIDFHKYVLQIPTSKTKCWTARRRGALCVYGVKSFYLYPESLLWYCNAEFTEHLWRVMFDTRSKINKLCTNLYQTPISTNDTK